MSTTIDRSLLPPPRPDLANSSNEQVITIEDCYTACAALEEGISEAIRYDNTKVSQETKFALLGGAGIAAITARYVPKSSGSDAFRRQTQDIDIELKSNLTAQQLAPYLAKYNPLPKKVSLPFTTPGGAFEPTNSGFKFVRARSTPAKADGVNIPDPLPIDFDVHYVETSRLQYYIKPGALFSVDDSGAPINVITVAPLGSDAAFKVLCAPLLLLLKLSSHRNRKPGDKKGINDLIDARLLLNYAGPLGLNRDAFKRFRDFKPPESPNAVHDTTVAQIAQWLATLVALDDEASKKAIAKYQQENPKGSKGYNPDYKVEIFTGDSFAAEVVKYELEHGYYGFGDAWGTADPAQVEAAKKAWIGNFKQLYDFLKA